MRYNKFTLFFVCILASWSLQAQSQFMFERLQYPVKEFGIDLKYPFLGGLNAPQFSVADLDNDLTQDLVLFDRVGNVLLTFINEGTPGNPDYVYRPEYALNFPAGLNDWILMRDFDRDGIMDMFCAALSVASQEIQLFKGYYDGHGLKFTQHLFSYPQGCTSCNPLYIFYPDNMPGFWNNFPINRGDLPSIEDIDGDGDLDLVAFIAGTSTSLTMLRNTSVENGLPLSKPQYELYDNCWGRFFENGMEGCKAQLSCHPDTCFIDCAGAQAPVAEERDGLHPGAAIATFDYDNDGDYELLLGNVSYPCMDLMFNGGTAQNAWMTAQDTSFPSNDVPIGIFTFPAPYLIDYDGDGHRDLIVALNNPTSGEDRRGVWLYDNMATTQGLHDFKLSTRGLFQDEMIEIGTGAHPAIADVNADGLLDIVVGNYGYYTNINNAATFTNARLYLYLNIGTPTSPAFELVDSDYAGLSQFAPLDYDFSPTFGDIDSDGDLDLLVGNNIGGIYCYRNIAGPGQPFVFQYDTNPMWLGLDVIGQVSAPIVYDLDQDGLQDLVIGERAGNINFFKNTGSANNPMYPASPTLQKIGQIDARVPPEVVGMSVPAIVQTPDGPIIVVGTQRGHLEAYYLQGANQDTFTVIDLKWGNIDEGNRSHPVFADLDGDDVLEMVIGNQRGGLSVFRTELVEVNVPLSVNTPKQAPAIHISPNPARAWAHIDWPVQAQVQYQVFNAVGQMIASGEESSGSFNIEVKGWSPGIYMLQATSKGQSATARIVVFE
ncbi:MAG: T9SS type A sorting domain-containing protein [Chitinophagales bacterium]|nr:T9SS type A sorting domain-containing protein [Chitinophagales bacterium]